MKIGLQIILGILSLIPLSFGSINLYLGAARFIPIDQVTAALDSQFRFQSAYYLGLAVIIWWIIPTIERHTTLFRIIISVLFLGGLGRLYSYFTLGAPPTGMFYGMILELCLPILIIWQARVASKISN